MLKNPHFQTITAALLPTIGRLKFTTHIIQLDDGDAIHYHFSPAKSQEKIALVLHGLAGSANSPYVKRLAMKLQKAGMSVARMEFRNYGKGHAKAKHLPHAGRSEDALACIKALHQKYPNAQITLIGFSMGGNISLKLAGEQSDMLKGYNVKRVLAVAPPINLAKCADLLEKPINKPYRYCFISALNKMVVQRHRLFPELGPAIKFPLNTGMWEFDDVYTARFSEFDSAKEYYARCSAQRVIDQISIQTDVFVSADDPFIDKTAFDLLMSNPHISFTKWPFGGHMGCLGNPFKKSGLFWMDHKIIEALQQ